MITNTISGNIVGGGALILMIIYTIMVLASYHNRYFVWYSNLAVGLKWELISALIIAFIMTAITFIFWPIIVALIGLVVFLNVRKATSLFMRLIWIIPASIVSTFVAVVGICLWIN